MIVQSLMADGTLAPPEKWEGELACFQLIEKLIKNKINGDRVVCYFICTYFIVVDFWVGETDVFIDG